MVRDRLAEMQAVNQEGENPSKTKKKEQNAAFVLSSDEQLTECLAVVTKIDDRIKKIKDEVEDMGKLQRNILSNPMIDKKEVQKLGQISDKIFNSSEQIKKEINSYRTELPAMKMESRHESMITNHLTRLSGDVTRTMNDLRATQMDYIRKSQKLHSKTTEIVTGAEGGEMEASADTKNMQSVFVGDFLMEAEKAKMELQDIKARDLEIKKLEGSVFEVNQLFKEVNALVMEQGEMIDTIENHVNAAVVDVEAGGVQLRQARRLQSGARRKKICCIGILVAILIIAGIIIAIVVTENNKNN